MTAIDEKAVGFIFRVLNDLDSEAEVYFDRHLVKLFTYRFQITSKGQEVDLEFSRPIMDDFEIAINKHKETNYYYTLENHIKFEIYIQLGLKGLLTEFDVSSELLNEKDQWLESCSANVSFDNRTCETLNNGLSKLSIFLAQVLEDHNLDLRDVKAEKEHIDSLIQYYKNNGHLNSEDVGVESIAILKAAAICEILEKEKQRYQTNIDRVRSAINKEIYKIVHLLRQKPFLGIRLPECIRDYYNSTRENDIQEIHRGPQVKIAYPTEDRLDALLDNLNPNFKKKRIGAWMTFNSDNPDRLSQAANSMVELLDKVINQLCANRKLSEYLEEKYETNEETQWIEATRRWISQTKSKLHRVKHHQDYRSETLARTLLTSAETIMLALLE